MWEFKGTPAPWKWFTSNSHKRLSSVLSGKDGDVLYAYNDSTGFPMIGCNERDMVLIAAAPELLEALQDMLSGWKYIRQTHGDLYGVGWDRAEQKATEAITKALGQ